ncbi:MAG: diguanylate cyclase domain-containing protein [Magnetovibrionaceae bacterium]
MTENHDSGLADFWKTDALYRTLIDYMQDGLFLTKGGIVLFGNQAAYRMLGYPEGELSGVAVPDLIAPYDREWVRDRHMNRIAGGNEPSSYEFDMLKWDGKTTISVVINIGVVDTDGDDVVAVACIKDISESQRLKEKLARSEAELRSIIDHIPDIFYRTDKAGLVEMVSPSVEVNLGYKVEDVVGRPLTDFYVDPEERAAVVETVMSLKGKPATVESRLRRANGEAAWFATKAFVRLDDDGTYHGVEGISRDITQQKQAEEELREMAGRDPLTHLPNRLVCNQRLERAISRAKRAGNLVALLFLDLDHFKPVNDRFGHNAGDTLLVEIAERLEATVREVDTVGRLGGDEFLIILEGVDEHPLVTQTADRILRTVERPVSIGGEDVRVSASIGIALYPENGNDAEALVRHSDRAMYATKQAGRAGFRFYQDQ